MARKQAVKAYVQDWPGYVQCEWNSNGVRCKYPGTMSHSTGPGDWLCSPHWGCRDAIEGAAIVEASQGYRHPSPRETDQAFHDEVEAKANALGLDTTAKRKAWLRQHWPSAAAWDTGSAPREPGDDHDEDNPHS